MLLLRVVQGRTVHSPKMKLAILRKPALDASRIVPLTAQHAGKNPAQHSILHTTRTSTAGQLEDTRMRSVCLTESASAPKTTRYRELVVAKVCQMLLAAGPEPMRLTCHLCNEHGRILPQLCRRLAIPPVALAAQRPDHCVQRLLTLAHFPAEIIKGSELVHGGYAAM